MEFCWDVGDFFCELWLFEVGTNGGWEGLELVAELGNGGVELSF